MDVQDLVELGASVAFHGTCFVPHSPRLTERHMKHYWVASRVRHDRWSKTLKHHELATSFEKRQHWPRVRAVMEEILAGELLTRLWAAVGCAFDQSHATNQLTPIVRSVATIHMEARNRVLRALMQSEQVNGEGVASLNRLRQITERWTDKMLGHLAAHRDVAEFAFDANRVCDFAQDTTEAAFHPGATPLWELTRASLRASYQDALTATSPHPDLNQRIAGSILACLNSDLFHSSHTFTAHWAVRLHQITEDAQDLLAELQSKPDQDTCHTSPRES